MNKELNKLNTRIIDICNARKESTEQFIVELQEWLIDAGVASYKLSDNDDVCLPFETLRDNMIPRDFIAVIPWIRANTVVTYDRDGNAKLNQDTLDKLEKAGVSASEHKKQLKTLADSVNWSQYFDDLAEQRKANAQNPDKVIEVEKRIDALVAFVQKLPSKPNPVTMSASAVNYKLALLKTAIESLQDASNVTINE